MPGLDGPGFYRELERCHPHLVSRVISLTGDVLSPEAHAFFDQVKNLRLIKPFKAQEVRRAIRQVRRWANGGVVHVQVIPDGPNDNLAGIEPDSELDGNAMGTMHFPAV